MAILEAMSAGLPVVAYDRAGAAREFLRDGVNGYLVEEGDCDALATSIKRVVASHAHYWRLSSGARRTAEGYDVRDAARRLAEGLQRVVHQYASKSEHASGG
jgi:glycosyltransferase involved in cell wall biosynthesis